MYERRSRYLKVRRYEASADGTLPFKGVRPRPIAIATPVLEYTFQPGQRFDSLAVHFYNESRLWIRILDANPDVLCAAPLELVGLPPLPRSVAAAQSFVTAGDVGPDAELGETLLIPRATETGT